MVYFWVERTVCGAIRTVYGRSSFALKQADELLSLIRIAVVRTIQRRRQMQWKLTQRTYGRRVEWEDGHGSLQNIVEDMSMGRPRVWHEPDEKPKDRVLRGAQARIPRIEYEDTWNEEVYWLECRKDDSSKWEFVDVLRPKLEDDRCDDWDEYWDDGRQEEEEEE
jgi:hypothetical protein